MQRKHVAFNPTLTLEIFMMTAFQPYQHTALPSLQQARHTYQLASSRYDAAFDAFYNFTDVFRAGFSEHERYASLKSGYIEAGAELDRARASFNAALKAESERLPGLPYVSTFGAS